MLQSSCIQITTPQELRNLLLQHIATEQFTFQMPPYMSKFYHPLRKRYFQIYKPLLVQDKIQRNRALYEFIQIVDEEVLNMFQAQLSKPYQDMIMVKHYGIPPDLDVLELQKDNKTLQALTVLVGKIAEWNIQIEKTVDNIDRVQLYELWTPDKSINDVPLNAELKSLLAPSNDFDAGAYTKHMMINLLSYGADKFSKFLYESGLSKSKLTMGAALLIFNAVVGGQALPWHVLIPKQQISWVLGGFLGSLALGKVSAYLDKYDKLEQIYGLARVFEEITELLVEFNESLTITVNECLLIVNDQEEEAKKKKLKQVLDKFLAAPDEIKDQVVIITAQDIIDHEKDSWNVLQ